MGEMFTAKGSLFILTLEMVAERGRARVVGKKVDSFCDEVEQ